MREGNGMIVLEFYFSMLLVKRWKILVSEEIVQEDYPWSGQCC